MSSWLLLLQFLRHRIRLFLTPPPKSGDANPYAFPQGALYPSGDAWIYAGDGPNQNAVEVNSPISLPTLKFVGETGAGLTINDLRQAFQVQKLLERDARGGTRYTEILRSHFGVVSPDARLQRPEYLGGSSTRILMNSVAQTAATNDVTPQANLSPLACSVIVSMASLNRLWSMATSSVLLTFVLTFRISRALTVCGRVNRALISISLSLPI